MSIHWGVGHSFFCHHMSSNTMYTWLESQSKNIQRINSHVQHGGSRLKYGGSVDEDEEIGDVGEELAADIGLTLDAEWKFTGIVAMAAAAEGYMR